MAGRRLQGTPLPDHLRDHSGRDFAPSGQHSPLRDHQAARGREEDAGGLGPMTGDGTLMMRKSMIIPVPG